MRARKLIMTLMAALCVGSTAAACPFCNGGSSGVNEIKAGIFNDMFWPRAAAVLAPFPIFLALVALIYFWPQRRLSAQPQRSAAGR
ncbi:MAG: hypothetical protein ACTHK7_04955 [Aureliella sp.]